MPLPPLSAHEKRLGSFAVASALLYAASGLFFAALPHLTLRIAAFGERLSFGPGARLWHSLAISMMAMLALCSWLASRAPRENRLLLLPVILSKACSCAVAAVHLAAWRPHHAEAFAGRRTLWVVIATDFPLFLATAWFYWKAAPGVNFASQGHRVELEQADAPKPVPLGIAKASGTKLD